MNNNLDKYNADDGIDWEPDESDFQRVKMCDWCGSRPVAYEDEAHSLCENCRDQMFGD